MLASDVSDRFDYKDFLYAVYIVAGYYIFLYLSNHFGFLFLLEVLAWVSYLLAIIIYCGFLVRSLIRSKLKSASSALVAIAILAAALLFGHALRDIFFYAIDYGRLAASREYYDAKIRKISEQQNGSELAFFDWGSTGFLGTNIFFSLVYDESGEITLSNEMRSSHWKTRAATLHSIIADRNCNSSVRHLRSNFYTTTTICQ